MPARYDINLDKNESFVFYVKYKDEDGNSVDLGLDSGYTAEMKVVRYYDDSEKILHFQSSPYGITVGTTGSNESGSGVSGGITMNVSYTGAMWMHGGSSCTGGIYIIADANSTKGITSGEYLYDLKLNKDQVSTKLLEGTFTVRGSAT